MDLVSKQTPSIAIYFGFMILADAIILLSISLNLKYSVLFFAGLIIFALLVRYPEVVLAIVINAYFLIEMIGKPFEKHNELMLLTKLLAVCGLLVLWWRYRVDLSFAVKPIFVFSFLLGLILLGGIKRSGAPDYGFYKTVYFFFNNIFVLASVAFLARFVDRLEKFYLYLIGFGVLLGLGGLLKLGLGLEEGSRLTVFDVNPIWLSRSMGLSIILSYFFFSTGNKIQKCLIAFLATLLCLAMIFTASRGPIIGLFLTAITYYLVFSKRSATRRAGYFLLSLFFLFLVFLALPENVTSRYFEFGGRRDISGLMRIAWFNTILPVIKNDYLLGVGTGGFSKLVMGTDMRAYPHNIIAEIGLENGVIGLTVWGLFLLFTIRNAFSLINSEENSTVVQLTVCAFLVLVFSVFNAMFSGDSPMNEQIWLAAGIILGLHTYQHCRVANHAAH